MSDVLAFRIPGRWVFHRDPRCRHLIGATVELYRLEPVEVHIIGKSRKVSFCRRCGYKRL